MEASLGLRGRQTIQVETVNDLVETIWTRLNEVAVIPAVGLWDSLDSEQRLVLYVLLGVAAGFGFVLGRRRLPSVRGLRLGGFQNRGEAMVAEVLHRGFNSPDYHLMNHVTLPMADGTTQIDHILVSRFGVFVIETKHYSGWIFASAESRKWTQVLYRVRFRFQNPIFQNRRHVRAVRSLLDFLPPDAIKSVVVFSGTAEFRTETPFGVFMLLELEDYLREQTEELMATNKLQYCVGRLETARLAISDQTDVAHVQSLERRYGRASP